MDKYNARDLFQSQSELVDSKVDIAVSKAIERVIDQINGLKFEMHKDIHGLRRDMDKQFSFLGESLGQRVTAVESTLTFIKDAQHQISTKFIEYTFKAGWLLLAASISYITAHYLGLIS